MDNKTLKVFLISNMYPSNRHPRYGVFVKNFKSQLELNNIVFSQKSVLLDTKKVSSAQKLVKYIKFYLEIIHIGLFKRDSFDLVYIHFPILVAIPVFIISFFNKNIVLNFHGSDLYPNSILKRVMHPFQLLLAKKSLAIIVPSEYFKKEVKSVLGVKNSKIIVYPSGGINSKLFYKLSSQKRSGFMREMSIKQEERVIGFTSNFIKSKGWEVFLNAIKIFDSNVNLAYKVIMIGDGPDKLNIQKAIKKMCLQNNVILVDSMDQAKLNTFYNVFDVFIFPTMRNEESLGLVGLEAMACATPVIGSNIAGLKGYLKSGYNGYLFSSGDSNELFRCLKIFFSLTKKERARMKNNALLTSQQYDSILTSKKLALKLRTLI